MESNEIVQAGGTPNAMMMMAIEKGADLEKIEKLLELQMRYEANEGKKVFCSSMVEVHKGIPVVAKTLENTQTRSWYASLDAIIYQAKKVYTLHGFSCIFYEGNTEKENHIRVCADVIHSAGHKETYYYDVPLDGKGLQGKVNMIPIHAKSSSVQYGRRYLMCMIWNIPTGDDDDGNGADVEVVSDDQLHSLEAVIATKKIDMEKLCKYLKVDTLEKLPVAKYSLALSAINSAKDKGAE